MRWDTDVGVPLSASAIDESTNTVHVTTERRLFTLERSTGRIADWFDLAEAPSGRPIMGTDAELYLPVPNGVERVNLASSTTAPVWTATADQYFRGVVALPGGLLLIVVAEHTTFVNRVDAIDPASGVVIWSHGTGHFQRELPLVDGDAVYLVNPDSSGSLCALDASSGDERWCTAPDSETRYVDPPTVHAGTIFAPIEQWSNTGEPTFALRCLDAETGAAGHDLLHWAGVSKITAPVTLDGGTLHALAEAPTSGSATVILTIDELGQLLDELDIGVRGLLVEEQLEVETQYYFGAELIAAGDQLVLAHDSVERYSPTEGRTAGYGYRFLDQTERRAIVSGNTLFQSTSDGRVLAIDLAAGTVATECVPCAPSCVGTTQLQQCSSDGHEQLHTAIACPEDLPCQNGECGNCLPEHHRECNAEGNPQWIDSCGFAGDLLDSCATLQRCEGGECVGRRSSCACACECTLGTGSRQCTAYGSPQCGPTCDDECRELCSTMGSLVSSSGSCSLEGD